MPEFAWKSALAGVIEPGVHGARRDDPGVVVGEIVRSLISIVPRAGRDERVSEILAERVGITLPEAGRFATSGETTLLWAGLGQWILAGPPGGAPDFADLAAALSGEAAATTQGDGRAMVRIAGRDARAVLAKLCAVDLHPRRFGPGNCAATRVAHLGALLHQIDDTPTFEIHVFRAFARSFWEELVEAAEEFGYRVQE